MANFKQLLTQSWLVQKHSALEMHKVSPIGSGLLWGAAGSATFATVAAFNAARKNKNSPHSGDGWATAAKWSGGIALASKIGSVAAFSKAGLSGGFKGFSQRVEKRANEEYNGLLTKNKPGLQAPVKPEPEDIKIYPSVKGSSINDPTRRRTNLIKETRKEMEEVGVGKYYDFHYVKHMPPAYSEKARRWREISKASQNLVRKDYSAPLLVVDHKWDYEAIHGEGTWSREIWENIRNRPLPANK